MLDIVYMLYMLYMVGTWWESSGHGGHMVDIMGMLYMVGTCCACCTWWRAHGVYTVYVEAHVEAHVEVYVEAHLRETSNSPRDSVAQSTRNRTSFKRRIKLAYLGVRQGETIGRR